jgi:hypothetical protein
VSPANNLEYCASKERANSKPGFKADRVFQELYEQCIIRAIEEYSVLQDDLPARFCRAVQDELSQLVSELRDDDTKSIYLRVLRKLRSKGLTLRTSTSCTFCMHVSSERLLRCGHSICDTCLQIFGTSPANPYSAVLEICPLCGEKQHRYSVALLPPTTGYRLLSMDAGDIQAVIALTFLLNLETSLQQFRCPLWTQFDLVCVPIEGK